MPAMEWIPVFARRRFPSHGRVVQSQAISVDPVKDRPGTSGHSGSGCVVASRTFPRVHPLGALKRLRMPANRQVDGQHQDRTSRSLGPPNQLQGHLPTRRRVQLKPDRPPGRLRHFLNCAGTGGGKNLKRSFDIGRARRRQFTVGVKRLLAPGRRNHYRSLPHGSENLGSQIGFADVDQPSRPDLDSAESFPVRANRHIVVHSRFEIAEVRRRNRLPRGCFEVHYIQGVPRIGNDRRILLRMNPRCEQRTCCDEFQKPAPALS